MLLKIRFWIPFAVTITCLCGLLYGVLQQNYRQSANTEPFAIATELAYQLDNDQYKENGYGDIDVEHTTTSFTVIIDRHGNVTHTNAKPNSYVEDIPEGVLQYSDIHGQNIVTRETRAGIRIATVVIPYSNGYVVVGKNLSETERVIGQLGIQIVLGWIITLFLSFVSVIVFIPNTPKRK